jgi:alpha-amylase
MGSGLDQTGWKAGPTSGQQWGWRMVRGFRVELGWVVAGVTLVAGFAAPVARGEVADDVFYMYMPIAWRDSNNDAQRFGDFGGMTAALDYLEDLGITAVWMTPIFTSPAYHGYQHGSGLVVNSRFGTEAEFWSFVSAAHARGIKVYIDFVVYGISHSTVWYQSAYGNPSSPYDNWFSFTDTANTQSNLSYTYPTWNGDTVGFIHWNLNNTDCTNMITGWAKHWLDPNNDGNPSDGIDGYRLDHVSAYDAQESPWGYDIAWWQAWKAALQTVNPGVFTFAEPADWGSHGEDLLPAHDAVFTKPFEFAARDALSTETAAGLYTEMSATLGSLPAGKLCLTTLGDHDVDRLASTIGGDLNKAKAAAAILLLQPFPPVLYFGDEIGMLGTKQVYGGDANDIPMREPFKWNAVAGAPMSNYWVLNSQAYNNAFSQDNDGRSVEEQTGVSTSLLEAYRTLIATRTSHVALRRGTYYAVPNSSTRVWSFVRHAGIQETLLVAINVYGSSRSITLNLADYTIPGGASTVQDVMTGAYLTNLTDTNQAAYPLNVDAYGYRILALNVIPPEPVLWVIDGCDLPADFGPQALVATQDNATNLGDNVSELDQLLVRPGNGGVNIGITGNLQPNGTGLVLLFDTAAGGQNPLTTTGYPPPGAIPAMNGLRFDAGFAPDHLIFINTRLGTITVDQFTLPSTGWTTKTYRGSGTVNDGDGNLSGGTNPSGMLVAMDNTNTLGVTATEVSGAATATTGFEMFIPYAYIGVGGPPHGQMGFVAYVVRGTGEVSNQWLPGVGGGYGSLGMAPDMTTIPGQQYTTVSLDLVGDWDGNGTVDAADYAHFPACMTGPDNGPPGAGCTVFDADADTDVDLGDFSAFAIGFNG